MSGDFLADRGKGLEEAFFANQNAQLRRRLAELDETTSKAAALSETSGITDPAVLDRLIGLGLSSATLAAMTLVPLVVVAWADGAIDGPEREVLLAQASEAGLDRAHPGYELFEAWLKVKPRPDLLAAWKAYVTALPAEARAALTPELLGRARAVAEAAGGFLGLGRKISAAEQAALDDLTQSLSA